MSFPLRAAGYRGPDLFSPGVLGYVARHSHGLTRRINIIADKILLAAFPEGTHNITAARLQAEAASRTSPPTQPSSPAQIKAALSGRDLLET